MRRTARAIILNEQGRLLVFERYRQQGEQDQLHHYYSMPGGGIEAGESPAQAVVRELKEEMLVDIELVRLVVHQYDETDERENFYFLARIAVGEPTFNLQSEEANRSWGILRNDYRVTWIDITDPLLMYHQAYGQIAAYLSVWQEQGRFPDEPVDIRLEKK